MNALHLCTNCFRIKGNNVVCPHCGKKSAPNPIEAYHLQPGTVLNGRYLIGKVVGYGGFGVIYKSFDMTLGIVVAIKEFFPVNLVCRVPGETKVSVFSGDRDVEFRKGIDRFLEEARKMAAFGKNPNIVDIMGFFTENGTAYIIMEYLDGISMSEYIKNSGGKIPAEEAIEILQHVIDGLRVLHNGGVIHRDINPKNIIITVDNKIKIIDFGAAKFCRDGEKIDDRLDNVVTEGYAPPEQYRNNGVQGTYTDVYGVGATLYRAITGETPINSLDRRKNDPLKRPSELVGGISQNIDIAIMKAMAFKCEYRFKTVDELADALAFEKNNYDYPEEEEHKRFVRKITVAVSLLVAVVIGCVAFFGMTQRDSLYDTIKGSIDEDEEILVYVPYTGNRDEIEDDYESASKKFSEYAKKYYGKNLTVTYKFISAENYKSEIEENIDEVCMFCSDVYKSGKIETYDLTPLYNDIKDDYLFYSQYSYIYTEFDRLPLGISVPILYTNKINKNKSLPDFETWESYLNNVPKSECLCISSDGYPALFYSMKNSGVSADEAAEILRRTLDDGKLQNSDSYEYFFLSSKSTAFVGSTVYKSVIDKSDIFIKTNAIDLPGNEKRYVSFTQEWSISNEIDKSKKNTAILFLRYLISTDCQADTVPGGIIACNKNTLKEQADIYGGVFEEYKNNPENFVIISDSSEGKLFETDFRRNVESGKISENEILAFTKKYF